MNLKNYTNQEILIELEQRFDRNYLTRKDLATLSSIITEHLYLFYRTFQPNAKPKTKTEDHYNNLPKDEQEKVDKFFERHGFKIKNDK